MYEQEKGQMECGKITQVQNELTSTKKIVAESNEMVMRLLGVLAPIMRGGLEEVEPSNRVEKELVPLAREMSDINTDLEINSRRLSQILDRLEL
jgi:hypothetical protein